MRPADGVLTAAQRWLHLLERSTVPQAAALIRAHADYTDLSTTQYATALDWLVGLDLLAEGPAGLQLAVVARALSQQRARELLFARTLEQMAPPWLPDADVLVLDAGDLPQDAADVAAVLGVDEAAAFLTVRQVHGRIDLAERARVGAAGERGLVDLLEEQWPGSTTHVALSDDGLGYDIDLRLETGSWHLEVKTTGRRGRLTLYLSRHEYEVSRADARWRLVVVGLDDNAQPAALATVRHEVLLSRAPQDCHRATRWESARHQLGGEDLLPGLAFIGSDEKSAPAQAFLRRGYSDRMGATGSFAWMPVR